MIQASLYIIACTARNRMRQRLRRLREPRYLLGAIAGSAYLYFTVFARMRLSSELAGDPALRRRLTPAAIVPGLNASSPALFGLALLFAAAASWVFPGGSSLLEFTRAEIQFLFPAPVTRRQLLLHRLLRSQMAVFLGALIMVLAYPLLCVVLTPFFVISSLFGDGEYADKFGRSYQGLWKAMIQTNTGSP